MKRIIIFSKPIPFEELNKQGFFYGIIDKQKILISLNKMDLSFYGYSYNDNLVSIDLTDFMNHKLIIEKFIQMFNVLFMTDDEMELLEREPNISIENLYDRALREYGLQKYLRYNKLKKLTNG